MQPTTTNQFTEEVFTIDAASRTDRDKLPVLRVDLQGKILFANEASLAFLNEILSSSKDQIPVDFIGRIPGMLNLNADFSVPIEVSSQTMMFDVIGFMEHGYVGLYGYVSTDRQTPLITN